MDCRFLVILLAVAVQVFDVSAQDPTLSQTPEQVCPGDEVTFTCTVPVASLLWEYLGVTEAVIAAALDDIQPVAVLGPFQVRVVDRTIGGGGVFTSITSTLSTTASTTMNGDNVICHNPAGINISSSVPVDVRQTDLPAPMIDVGNIVEQSLTCVVVPLQPPVDTMCIDSYSVEVLDEGNNPVGSGTTIGTATEVTVCNLNLCQGPLTFRARSDGEELGSLTDTTTYTATLPTLEPVTGVRRSDGGNLMWNAPSNTPEHCILTYDIHVGSMTRMSSTTSFSLFSDGLPTCSMDVVTVTPRGAGPITGSTSGDYELAQGFPSPQSVEVSLNYTGSGPVVTVTWQNGNSLNSFFPDASISITTDRDIGSSCTRSLSPVGTFNGLYELQCSPVFDLTDMLPVRFTVTFQSGSAEGCTINSSSKPITLANVIGPNQVEVDIDADDNLATVTLIFRGILFAPGIFRVMVTIQGVPPVSEVLVDQSRIEFVFTGLDQGTTYSYNITIQSTTNSTVVIGRSTGTFTTDGPASSIPIWIAAPIVIGVLLLLATGCLVSICICKQRIKHSPSDSQQPGPLYEDMSSHEKSRDIALEENVAYGPVTPQQPAVMYEEVSAQPEKIEMSGNVAYRQISH